MPFAQLVRSFPTQIIALALLFPALVPNDAAARDDSHGTVQPASQCGLASPAPPITSPVQSIAGPVQAIASWHGTVQHRHLLELAPTQGFITESATWQQLWQAWRSGLQVPELDFARHLVVIGTAPGPNRVRLRLHTDEQGGLAVHSSSTRKAGPGFGYALALVPRAGLQSVAGVMLGVDQQTHDAPATEPCPAPGSRRASSLSMHPLNSSSSIPSCDFFRRLAPSPWHCLACVSQCYTARRGHRSLAQSSATLRPRADPAGGRP